MLTAKDGSLFEPRDLWVVLFFLVVSIGYLREPLLEGKSFAIDNTSRYLPWKESGSFDPSRQNNGGTDGTLTFYPRRYYSHKLLSRGEFPLWTPYLLGGLPFMADPHTAVWYPPNALFVFLGPDEALKALACLQLFLAGVFMYFLLREWGLARWAAMFGGVVFMFNPFFVTHFVNPTNVDAGVWLPLMMLLFDLALRKNFLFYAMLLSGAVACTLLGGFPQISILAMYALGLYSLVRAAMEWRARRAAFTSVQMFAVAEFSRHSARVKVDYSEFEAVFIQPETLLMFAAPQFFGPFTKNWYGLFARALAPEGAKSAFWQNSFLENNGYVGVLPLLLLVIGLYHARASPLMWTGAAIGALALSMTMGAPIFKLAYHALPGFTFSRICRIVYLYGFGVAIVASFGLHWLLVHRAETRRSPAFRCWRAPPSPR
ncbi:MAG: hypothetical protein K8I02_11235 [Candidatus Methylomirabilis sp.]|nr:hypothetical protein [Deltaproteobacteria bacterium]